MEKPPCRVEGCPRIANASRGYCRAHYEAWRTHGNPLIKLKGGAKSPVKPGDVYGRLTAIRDTGERRKTGNKSPIWLCRCKCGNEVKVLAFSLTSQHTRSCGCLQRDVARGVAPRTAGKVREIARANHMMKKFGLTLEEADAMLAAGCAICGVHSDRNRRLCIDHDHGNGKPRGALCLKCNSMIGMADDDPERLRAAIAYLEAARDK